MKTIEIQEIAFSQDLDRFDIKSYPSTGIYLVSQQKPKGLGFAELVSVVNNVLILPNELRHCIQETKQQTPTTEKGLSKSFVLELVKIINK